MPTPIRCALALAILQTLQIAHAQAADNDQVVRLDRLTVIGNAENARTLAGSAAYLDNEALQKFGYSDVQRVLRQVPGVYVVDEEGYGLRPNIGIRGSGTDRSSRITVMEDGVLIAPAAYAAPAAYYFPTMSRISAVEARKGTAAIKAGPRTTGGAINLISTPIPVQTSGLLDFAYGTDSSVLAHGWAGGSSERTGWLLETAQQRTDGFKRLDGGGDTGYTLEDYLGKFRLTSAADAQFYQSLEFKIGRTEQDSDETYLGLTDGDFSADPNRRYAASQLDNITSEHEQYELRHRIEFSTALDLTTVVYRNEFQRNWYKLNDVQGTSLSAILADPVAHAARYSWLTGANSPDGVLRMRNNNRAYISEGAQTVLGWALDAGAGSHQFEFGLRWHKDEEDRFQSDDRFRMDNGRMVLTSRGLPGSQENRIGKAEAWSFYAQDDIGLGDWTVTPGFRYEHIDLTRIDYVRSADGRSQPPVQVIETSTSAFTPGVGVSYRINDNWNAFAGLNRGFNPAGPGSNADPEESVNFETGVRYRTGALQAELVGFWNDYDNLVGTCTASSGGNCTIGDQFDGGKVRMRGVEASVSYDAGRAAGWALGMPISAGYTYTDAEFRTSFNSSFEEWTVVERGDQLPYLPEQTLNVQIGLEGERWRVNLGGNYIDRMRTVAGQGAIPAGERTEAAVIFDVSASYRLTPQAELFARVENLSDEVWIASRRPSGARPGEPRRSLLGMRVSF